MIVCYNSSATYIHTSTDPFINQFPGRAIQTHLTMDVYYVYTYSTAAWLFLQATPLLASPKLIITLLSIEVKEPSALEMYFARSSGMGLIVIGVLNLLLTGSVPLTSRLQAPDASDNSEAADPKAPYALPTLTLTMLYHAVSGFYTYALWTDTGVFYFAIGMAGSSLLASIGLWCVLFATSDGRISKKTGADKRMSGWPFTNKEADKKKAMRRGR